MTRIKIVSEARGEHVHMTVRAGETEGSLGLCGLLVMRVGEWQLFGAALLLGAERMCGHLAVELPDQDIVVKALVEQSRAASSEAAASPAAEPATSWRWSSTSTGKPGDEE